MGIRTGEGWEKWEDEYVISNYKKKKLEEIGEYLNRSRIAAAQRINKLRSRGIIEKSGRKIWTDEEEQFLIDNYGKLEAYQMAEKLGVLPKQIHSKTKYMRSIGRIGNIEEMREQTTKEKARREKQQRELDKKYNKKYKESLAEEKRNRDYGIGKKEIDIKFEKDKRYLLEIYSPGEHRKLKLRRKIECKLVQATHNHVTFINKNDVRESFLKNDFLLGEIKVKEIA